MQRVFYNQTYGFMYQWMLVMSTQLIGFSIGGICRRFLVSPPSMSTHGSSLFLRVKILRLRLSPQFGPRIWSCARSSTLCTPKSTLGWGGEAAGRARNSSWSPSQPELSTVSLRTHSHSSFNPKGDTDAFVLLRIRFLPWLSVHRAVHVYVGVLDRAQQW